MTFIRVGILEDDPDMRAFLVRLVEETDDMEIAFSCGTLADARQSAMHCSADINLVDIRLPDGNGLDFIKDLGKTLSGRSLILTVLGDKASILLAFEVGASGYLLKDTPADQIKRDIRAVIAGSNPISPQAATHVLAMMATFKGGNEPPTQIEAILTQRELDVLTMFSRGLSYQEAAATLQISMHTINGHVKSIYSKMSVHSRNEAIFEAVQNGWLNL